MPDQKTNEVLWTIRLMAKRGLGGLAQTPGITPVEECGIEAVFKDAESTMRRDLEQRLGKSGFKLDRP